MDIYALIEAYKSDLEHYTLEQLQAGASEDNWSLGQLYHHLIGASLFMQLRNAEACASADREQPLGKTEAGEAVFRLDAFPPVKIKVPASPQYTPKNPESREELAAGLDLVKVKMEEWAGKIADVNPNMKMEHPRLGWLNAQEWYRLVAMHFRHHLRQKEELELRLGLPADVRARLAAVKAAAQ
ncbi:DinB family protein [Paenibacillus humicola]|uniref:DinB family protein n=1 Tax=Paenibacillus humicola TaxID=3110540 RepID=UPI00237A437B|nr:DinB family protein [Paenibacillus humicola]